MIHVERGTAPRSLRSKPVRARLAKATTFFSIPPDKRLQTRYKFFPAVLIDGVRDALAEAFHHKCAYCESPVTVDSYYDVESFRPRARAVDNDGDVAPDHYWWLIYEWTNLLLSCSTCNKLKGSRFPIAGKRAPVKTTDPALLRKEEPLLLDPCDDWPEEEMVFSSRGKVASETPRGRMTISVLGLNRAALIHARKSQFKLLQRQWVELGRLGTDKSRLVSRRLAELTHAAQPYAALRRQFISKWAYSAVRYNPSLRSALRPALALRTAFRHTAEASKFDVIFEPERPKRKKKAKPRESASSHRITDLLRQKVRDYESFEAHAESFSVAREAHKESYFAKSRLIERLEIKNFKLIESLHLTFPESPPQKGSWLLLLGENGTGKSSVLQAVALTLMGERHRSALRLNAGNFVRHGSESGYVKIYLTGIADPIELKFKQGSRRFKVIPEDPKVLLLGYGATRLLPRKGAKSGAARGAEFAKAYNLFNPFTPLVDATRWLSNLEKREFDRLARSLKELLLLKPKDRLIRNVKKASGIEVKAFGTVVTLEELSDGYQSIVGLTADIMSVMRQRWEAMEIAEGLVLIDEIDAHLHPTWKMRIIQRLRAVFPRLQFLVTSHDPLTLRGLYAGEVTVLQYGRKDRPIALRDLPSPDGLRVDQLLTSEYFGLNSTIDPATEEKFDEYYGLLALRKPTRKQQERLAQLKTEMNELELLGKSRRERLMLEATDEYLAQTSPEERLKLKPTTRKKIMNMWKTTSFGV